MNSNSVLDRIITVSKHYKNCIGMITGLGPSGICLLKFLQDAKIKIPIYFIDTGFNFKQTIQLKFKLEERFNIYITSLSADNELKSYVFKKYSQNPCNTKSNICCHLLKVTPLLEILPTKSIWMSGLRKSQSRLRSSTDVYGLDGRGTLKFNPIFDWSYDDVKSFISKHNLPYNPLLDLGYKSVGCRDVTIKSLVTDSCERSGRWHNSNQTECGINVF